MGAGSVAGENAPYIGSLERLATGERINDETGRVEKTSTTQKVFDAISLGADVAAMVPGKGKAVSTLVDKVKGVFGKGAASVGDDVIAAGARTEVIQRAMSKAELAATESSGLVRGGRSGTHYASDAVNADALRARQRLALQQTPEVKVTMEVPVRSFGPPAKISPKHNMPGGGMERKASGPVPARVIKAEDY